MGRRAEIDEGVGRCSTPRCAGTGRGRTRSRPPSPRATPPRRRADDTDWPQIAALYAELARRVPSPMVELNRAVAVAMADGPAAGLALVDATRREPASSTATTCCPRTRADLLRRLGRDPEAAAAYRRALALDPSAAEVRYLERRLAEVEHGALSRAGNDEGRWREPPASDPTAVSGRLRPSRAPARPRP